MNGKHKGKCSFWLSLLLIFALIVSGGFPFLPNIAEAAEENDGFVIHAERIEGKMLLPVVVIERTENGYQPLLRFRYESATIHGLTLTKVLDTPIGKMTIKIEAPVVHARRMVVDASRFSFGGICLSLGQSAENPVMKDVTLVAYRQTAEEIHLSGARILTPEGDHGYARPKVPQIFQLLSNLSLEEIRKKIEKMNKNGILLGCSSHEEQNENQPDQKTAVLPIHKNDEGHAIFPGMKADKMKEKLQDPAGAIRKKLDIPGEGGQIDETIRSIKEKTENIEKVARERSEQTAARLQQLIKQLLSQLGDLQQKALQLSGNVANTEKELQQLLENMKLDIVEPIEQLLVDGLTATEAEKVKERLLYLQTLLEKAKKLHEEVTAKRRQHALLQQTFYEQKEEAAALSSSILKQTVQETADHLEQINIQLTSMERQLFDFKHDTKRLLEQVTNIAENAASNSGIFGGMLGGLMNTIINELLSMTSELKQFLQSFM